MSHVYFTVDPSLTTLEQVQSASPLKLVQLSNTNHELVQEACGFSKRQFVNRDDPNDTMETYFHTTIHDKEPIFVFEYELWGMLDDAYDRRPDLQSSLDLLYALVEDLPADTKIYIF